MQLNSDTTYYNSVKIKITRNGADAFTCSVPWVCTLKCNLEVVHREEGGFRKFNNWRNVEKREV